MHLCYLDESGLDERSRSLVIAGYFATSIQWARFELDWRRTLGRYGVAHYHGREMQRCYFDGWGRARTAAFHDELVSLIEDHRLVGIAVGLLRDDYRAVITSQPSVISDRMERRQYEHPFFFVFQYALIHAVEAARLPEGRHLVVVADEQRQYQAWASGIHGILQNHPEWPAASRLGTLQFQSSRDAVPLQAADFLVGRARRELDRRVYAPSQPEHPLTARIRNRMLTMKYYTRDEIVARFEGATLHKQRWAIHA